MKALNASYKTTFSIPNAGSSLNYTCKEDDVDLLRLQM
jgi:hypothetical protein